MAVFVGFVHHRVKLLQPTLDVLAFAGIKITVARAKIEFTLPDLPQLRHEISGFLAGVRPVSKTMLDATKIMLIEGVEALISAEVLAVLTLVLILVLVFARLRHGWSPNGPDGRGYDKDTQKLFHRANPLLKGRDGRSYNTPHRE
ncbi:hypothetical protein JKL49_05145 [Phenylobacterium sp. 20VBR1]|uniref:Uncharacterized protein n=1 Tax=Phenylobacterium glaciei TaxID=2803784 RepID=A0A941HUK7_9CAUL|nr:hypothetical protein [Phenylobacterium glaciei]MBR7618769.1 hypothetical protein [Phenylobacterium glaciei]QQZ51136.1 hypothetical protein JKL49_08390 [Phenylobacterium glaciei]